MRIVLQRELHSESINVKSLSTPAVHDVPAIPAPKVPPGTTVLLAGPAVRAGSDDAGVKVQDCDLAAERRRVRSEEEQAGSMFCADSSK